jgi:hypothetical protein
LKETENVQKLICLKIISDARLSSYTELKKLAENRAEVKSAYPTAKLTIRLNTKIKNKRYEGF